MSFIWRNYITFEIKFEAMKYCYFLMVLCLWLLVSCEQPEDPPSNNFPYLTVDYRFSDPEVSVYSRHLAVTSDNGAVIYTGETKGETTNHIYNRATSYVKPLVQMTTADSTALAGYAVDLDGEDRVYYHQLYQVKEDSVVHRIYRADLTMNLGSPPPEVVCSFDHLLVGFSEEGSSAADHLTVSSDGLTFIIGWNEVGFYYLDLRGDEPISSILKDVVEAVFFPDGIRYVYADGLDNIYLASIGEHEPEYIGNGRHISVSEDGKVAWVKNQLLHLYDVDTKKITQYNPPKNVASAQDLMNATLSPDGRHLAFRSYDHLDSDIVFCSLP
ncbi:MAG: hypothetical protein CSA95_03045 [Bacteroidetes bacterium]|nr:MAG: hypothetical protein CSA95_03045 [Bacteroidota bacterium]